NKKPMNRSLFFLLYLILIPAGVFPQKASEDLSAVIKTVENRKSYDRDKYPLGLFTEDHYRQEAEFAEARLRELKKIKTSALSETERISKELLRFRLQENVDHYKYKAYLNPLLSDAGFHVSLPYQVRPLNDYEEVKRYLKKLEAIPQYVDQHLLLLKKGLEEGITQPLAIFKGYEATYNDQIVEDPTESFYYSPFLALPATLTPQQKDSVLQAAEQVIANKVVPQFRRIRDFFENEYFPNTRTS